MPKTITYERFRDMWNTITHEQRNTLKQAYADRYHTRIDVMDRHTREIIESVIDENKPSTRRMFMLYVIAITDRPEDWFTTAKQIYWSPQRKIQTHSNGFKP